LTRQSTRRKKVRMANDPQNFASRDEFTRR
jgi:hypothetical protein